MNYLQTEEDVEQASRRIHGWEGSSFSWTRWSSIPHHEEWTHDHCWFCSACICNHRDTIPMLKSELEERGCFRQAYYSEQKPGVYLWVCRSCFKRMQPIAGWMVVRSREKRPAQSPQLKRVSG